MDKNMDIKVTGQCHNITLTVKEALFVPYILVLSLKGQDQHMTKYR